MEVVGQPSEQALGRRGAAGGLQAVGRSCSSWRGFSRTYLAVEGADAVLLHVGRGHRGVGDKDVGDVGIVNFPERLAVKEGGEFRPHGSGANGLFLHGMFAESESTLVGERSGSKEFSVNYGYRGVP